MKTSTLLMISLLFCLPFVSAYAAETEPNNTRNTANTLALNGSNTGAINVSGDEDWWSVTINADGRLNITMAISNSISMRCQLYDNDGITLLASDYTSGTKTFSEDGLAAGTYYLRVYSFYSGQLPAYTISNTLTLPGQANDTEPNGSSAQATTLVLNNNTTGHIGYYYNLQRDSADWYKITTNADGRLRLTVTSHNGQSIYVYLYDNDGTTELDNGYTSGTAAVVNKDGLAAGTYYIRIRAFYSTGFVPYTLADSLFTPTQTNDIEPNGSRSEAIALPLNGSKTGHVGYYYSNKRDTTDWYKLTTNADGMISVTIESHNSKSIYAYIYDNDGSRLFASGYTSSSKPLQVDGLKPGTYYLLVKSFYSNDWVPYTLSNTLTTYTNADDAAAEPNEYYSQAKTIPANGSVTGHVNFYYNGQRDAEDRWKINYTGSGNMTLVFNQENRLSAGSTTSVYFRVYKDTTTSPIAGSYYSANSTTLNLTGLAQGYYYIRVYTFYGTELTYLSSYSITATFTQVNIAAVTLKPTAGLDCSATGILKIQCSGSLPPYIVQLYNFGEAYGSPITVNNSNAVNVNNLPTGFWSARVFGDGATGAAFGQTAGANLMPVPTGLAASNITATTVRLTFSNFSPCVDGYGVQYRKTGDSLWILDTAKKSPFTKKDLLPATQYTVRVASGDTAGGLTAISRYSDSITFTTLSASFTSVATVSNGNDIGVQKLPNAGIIAMPNPASGQLKLQVGSKINQLVNASLKDLNGRIVWSKFNVHSSALNNQAISVADMPNGLYLLHITGTDNKPIATLKIFVAH